MAPNRQVDMKLARAFYAYGILAITTGCTAQSVKTSEVTSQGKGVTYYLPMKHAKVTFERTKAESKAIENHTRAMVAFKEAEGSVKTAQAAVRAQEVLIEALKNAEGLGPDSAEVKVARGELVKLLQDVAAKSRALADATQKEQAAAAAVLAFNNADAMCGWIDTLKISLLDPVPDTSKRYQLNQDHDATRGDQFSIGTTPSGLLKTVDAKLEDKTGEILVALAKSVAAIRPGTAPGIRSSVPSPTAPPKCEELNWQPVSASWVIDPVVSSEWTDVSTAIRAVANVPPNAVGPGRAFPYSLSLAAGTTSIDPPSSAEGILYRRERPILIEATQDKNPIGGFILVVPNGAPADFVPIEATQFVSNEYKVGFDNGMLVSMNSTRPSELLEVVALPWKIAKETLSIVAEVFQLKVDYSTDKTALAEQQVKLVEQMEALIEAQRSLDATRKISQAVAAEDSKDDG